MKKLFTFIAFLAIALGAKAGWVEDYSLDYSTKTGFPFYVMDYVPEWVDGVMTDYGANYGYVETGGNAPDGGSLVGTVTTGGGVVYDKYQLASPAWHQYFIADGIPTEIGGSYRVIAMVRASEAVTINVNMGWGWGEGQSAGASVSIGTDWTEVEWNYNEIGGSSCNLVAQPGSSTAVIEWKKVTVSHNEKGSRPVVWRNLLTTNGEATGAYKDGVFATLYKSWENEYNSLPGDEIMKLVKMDVKPNADGVFQYQSVAVDKGQYTTNAKGESIENNFGWANQMFIVSPERIKSGDVIKVEFDYKASEAAKTNTQAHAQPSNYNHWQFMGDVDFTTEWQHASKQITIDDSMSPADKGMYSVAFNLNPENCNAVLFELKNLNISKMVLDEGWFIASSNNEKGIEYDLENAIQFVENGEDDFEATVGEKGDKDSWVNEVMISTVRGNDAAFKGNTIGLKHPVKGSDPEEWYEYTSSVMAKIKLPAAGVWNIHLDPTTYTIAFEMLEGEEIVEPIEIVPNPIEVTCEGNARVEADWDNQLWIIANRLLETGEETVIEFDYVCNLAEAKTGTQCQGMTAEGALDYLHWNAIGEVVFTNAVQHFSKEYKVAAEAAVKENTDGTHVYVKHGIVFNMACIEEACNYTIKNIVWKTKDGSESLIDMTGGNNFYVKSAGGSPQPVGISNVSVENSKNTVVYNLAGQRVSKSFKGIAIQNGHKVVLK